MTQFRDLCNVISSTQNTVITSVWFLECELLTYLLTYSMEQSPS